MNNLAAITSVPVLAGALLMLAALYQGDKARKSVPKEFYGRWRMALSLMLFFLTGYLLFISALVSGIPVPTEIIMGPVFFGGALFVFLVINLSQQAIRRIKAAEEDLRRVNESLEQRVQERTQELGHARDFLKTVVDSLNDAVSTIDVRDYRIVGANAPFLRETGLKEEEVIGRKCHEVTHSRRDVCTPPDDVCPLQETLKTGQHAVEEHLHYTAAGDRIYVEVSTSPVRDKDGNLIQVIHVSRDITERKRAEERLRRSADGLRTSNEDLKSFIYSVSHDLRAPLVNVKGFSAELEKTLREAEAVIHESRDDIRREDREKLISLFRNDVAEAIGFVSSSVARMDGLINAMLKLSRLGRRELRPEPVDMGDLTRFLAATLAHQIEQKHVAVTIGTLPRVIADPTAMEQIMGNILDNALKYLVPGRDGTVLVTAEQTARETVFGVRDNGRGIEKDDVPKVFEIFRRVGKQDVPGEGMGLSYVKALVRRHGGRIWCESEPGKGSTFSFTIPKELPEA